MDKIHHHFSESFSGSGAYFHSHYVPAEKPYAVYAYAWEGPTAAIAQHIGTMLVGEVNDKGKMVFDYRGVYRMPQKNMLDFDHCFIPEDMGELENDPIQLGFVGDTVGKDTLVKVIWMALKDADSYNVKYLLDNMQLAGLKVNLGDNCKMQDVEGWIDSEYDSKNGKKDYFLAVNEDIALRVKIWNNKGQCESAIEVVSELWGQMTAWQKVGISFESIKMKAHNKDYQDQQDELLELARLYGNLEKKEDEYCRLYRMFECREAIGTGRCLYDDFVMGMKKVRWDSYSGYDEDLQWAIKVGLITREGNIIQFSQEFERIATWKWTWKHGEGEE